MSVFMRQYRNIVARRLRVLELLAASFLLFSAGQATGQETNPDSSDGSTVTYPASYFEQFQPYSVNDMLERIPGITVARGGGPGGGGGGPGSSRGSDRRGLGAGGDQVLINGRRIAGKGNEGNSQLSRIPASQVSYIEIIRGTSGDLDVRGASQVINIVLLQAESSSTVAYEVNMDHTFDGKYRGGVKASLNGQRGALDYFLSGEREPRWEFRDSRETSLLADGSPNERIRRDQTRDAWPVTLTANFGYEFTANDVAHLNLQWVDDNQESVLERTLVDDKFDNPLVIYDEEDLPQDNQSWEVGGDYEHLFGNGSRFKTLFIVNESENLFVRERFDIDGADRNKNLYLSSFERNQERIVRSSYTFDLFSAQSLEAGVERAQTILDTSLQLGLLTGGDTSDYFGGLTGIRDNNGTVEEMRYEYFAIHNWQLSDRMSLETTLVYEDSNITQSGDLYQSRDFEFFRPKIDYRFDITPSLQFRTTIERDVAQLSFSDFTASAQTGGGTDDDQNELQGNPDLVQEKSWRYETNLEWRLPQDAGVVNTNLFYHEIEDVIGRIDVSTPTQVLSANGNVGDAERWGIGLDGSLRLGFVGQPNMLFTWGVDLEDSSIVDPFTGEDRRLSRRGRGNTSWGLRHDIPERNMNWGFNIRNGIDGNSIFYDIDKTEEYSGDPSYFAWFEMLGWRRLTYRFEARDGRYRCRFRTRYDNRAVGDGGFRETEDSCFTTGPVYAIKIRGTF
jgi:outer membrane receptor for ferrienterochelin and colicins